MMRPRVRRCRNGVGMSKTALDEKDRALLALLQADAREPAASLARKLGLSRTAVQDRVRKLERNGVILGYTLRLASEIDDMEYAQAHVLISVDPKQSNAVVRALESFPEIRALYAVSGEYDLLARVCAPMLEDIDAVLDEVGAIAGVHRTRSSLVLSAKFER